jgi:hypothetical protein
MRPVPTANENTAAHAPPHPPPSRLRWWLVFPIALPLIVVDAFWVITAEKVGNGPYFTTVSLFANVFFILAVLLAGNALIRRLVPRAPVLSQAELLLIYSMLAIGAAIAGHDFLPSLIQFLGHPYHVDTPENGWLGRFGQYLPTPLMVADKDALKGYYQGSSSIYYPENWHAWVRPCLLWSAFVVAMIWTMMCVNVLVRQGWQDRERLPFPIVAIPLQMTDPEGGLWRSPLFWLGFSIFAGIEILNGLAQLYPTLPSLNMNFVDISGKGLLANRPWNAAGFTAYSFYPFAVGLGYLIPTDLLFSSWFFYFVWKAQAILSASYDLDVVPDFPYVREQSVGGFLAIVVFLFWNGRTYFAEVFRRVLNEPAHIDDRAEALTYRQAFFGMMAGFVFLVCFLWWAGMSPLLAAAAFAFYFAISLAVTRIRAELGPPVHDLHFSGPDYIFTHSLGTASFGGQDLTLLSFFYWFNRAYRCHPQPFGIEGLKAAHDIRASQKVMFWGMAVAGLVGTFAVFWAYLHLAYKYGTEAKWANGFYFAQEAFSRLNTWVETPSQPNHGSTVAICVGFLFCALLMLARIRFPWWPLHPIGYVISSSWAINLVWMPLLFAWIIKASILRYGGVRLYQRLLPFFMGMILGQVLMGSAWHLISLWLGTVPYSFWGG